MYECNKHHSNLQIRLIDFGTLITKPGSSLRPHPQVDGVKIPALSTLTAISGIIPAGGSHTWGNLAKEAIKELIEGQESCRVVPKAGLSNRAWNLDQSLPVLIKYVQLIIVR